MSIKYFLLFLLLFSMFPIVSAQSHIYYFEAIAGYYYIIRGNYDALYIDNNGNRYWITTYQWDINDSYVILQSPVTSQIYVLPSQSTKPILNTKSWFYSPAITSNVHVDVTVTYPSPWSTSKTGSITPASIINVDYSYNGSVVLVNNTVLDYNYRYILLNATTSSTVSAAAYYNTSVLINSPFTLQFNITPRGVICSQAACRATDITHTDYWVVVKYDSPTPDAIYKLAYYSASVSGASISTQVSVRVSGPRVEAEAGDYNGYLVNVTSVGTVSNTTIGVFSPDQYGRIIASNCNVIVDVTNKLNSALLSYRIQQLQFTLPATTLKVKTSDNVENGVVLVFNTTGLASKITTLNPIVYVRELNAFFPIAIANFNTSKTIIASPIRVRGGEYTIDVIWNYPFTVLTFSNMTSRVVNRPVDLLPYLLIQGNVTVNDVIEPYYVFVSGFVQLLISNLIEASYVCSVCEEAPTTLISGNYTFILPLSNNNKFTGNITLYNITIYDTIYVVDNVNVTITITSSFAYNTYSVNVISLANIYSGTWSYKIPIHISLSELPVTPTLTFRLKLPIGVWVKQGLVSPSLEDLVLVDSENKPLPYMIMYWESSDYAVVYVKYPKPVSTSTLTIYALITNKMLWSTGVSFQSLSAFDIINPSFNFVFKDPVYNFTVMNTMGVYNYFVFRNYDKILIATTLADGVIIDPRGEITVYHGSLNTTYQIQPIVAVNELSVLIINSKVHVYADGTPQLSLDFSTIFPEHISTVHYVGWSGTTVYVTSSTLYTYSIGGLIGGVQAAPPVQIRGQNQQVAPQVQFDFWSILPLLFVLVILAIVIRLIQVKPSAPSGGVRLP